MYGNSRQDAMRQAMIQGLMQPRQTSNSTPNFGALFSPIAGALMQKKMDAQNQARDVRGNQVLAKALGAMQGRPAEYDKRTDIQWDAQQPNRQQGLSMLLQAPETKELGQQLAMAELQKQFGGNTTSPSSVREWEFYNSLSPEEQKAYINMKRSSLPKGMFMGQDGTAGNAPGVVQGMTQQAYGKETGAQTAKNENEPQREAEKTAAVLDAEAGNLGSPSKAEIAEQVAEGQVAGRAAGEGKEVLADIEARLPQIYSMTDSLRKLADKATYTTMGKVRDTVAKEFGHETEGAVAATEYATTVRTELMPLLRQTFGAQFTKAEGDWLMSTLGDAEMGPKAKQAAIDAFIEGKLNQVRSLRAKYGNDAGKYTTDFIPEGFGRATSAKTGGGDLTPEDKALLQRYGVE